MCLPAFPKKKSHVFLSSLTKTPIAALSLK